VHHQDDPRNIRNHELMPACVNTDSDIQGSPSRIDNMSKMCKSRLGLDEMLVARWLAQFMVSSARLGSARLNFFTS
jgi:hypothetical protein